MRIIAGIAVAFLLSACAAEPAQNRVYKPQTMQKSFDAPICVTGKNHELTRADKAQIADALNRVPRLSIDALTLRSNFAKASDKRDLQRIKDFLVTENIDATRIHYVMDDTLMGPRPVMTVTYSEAVPQACRYWESNAMNTFANANTPALGCATANNDGAMVAHPADLNGTRPEPRMDTERNSVVIQSYQKNEPIELKPITQSVTTAGGT